MNEQTKQKKFEIFNTAFLNMLPLCEHLTDAMQLTTKPYIKPVPALLKPIIINGFDPK